MPEKRISLQKARQFFDLISSLRRAKEEEKERIHRRSMEKQAYQLQVAKVAMAEQRDRRKYLLTKWADIMQKTEEGPSKDLLRQKLKRYYDVMPQYDQAVLKPYFEKLYDPVQEKMMRFNQLEPPPKLSGAKPEEDPLSYAYDQFALSDYSWKRDKFMGLDPGPVVNSLPITADTYAIRPAGGKQVKLMSLAEEEMRKEFSVLPGSPTPSMVAAAGWQWRTGDGALVNDGPNTYRTTPMMNFMPGDDYGKQYNKVSKIFTKKVITAKEMPEGVRQFLSYLGTDGDEKTEEGRRWVEMMSFREAGMSADEALARTVGQAYPGWNFRMIDPGVRKRIPFFFDWWSGTEKETVVACPGIKVWLPGMDNTMVPAFHDEETGLFYSMKCERIGVSEDAINWAVTVKGEERQK